MTDAHNAFRRGYALVGLHNPKNGLNVGAVLRAAYCYDAAGVYASGNRIQQLGRLKTTDTARAYRHMPLTRVANLSDVQPYNCQKVAVDLVPGAVPLDDFKHPESAMYIFGPEDGTLGAATMEQCQHKVFIPTRQCMNLAATVNVVLYDCLAKELARIRAAQ